MNYFKYHIAWGCLFLQDGESNFTLKNHNVKTFCPNVPKFGTGQVQTFCYTCVKFSFDLMPSTHSYNFLFGALQCSELAYRVLNPAFSTIYLELFGTSLEFDGGEEAPFLIHFPLWTPMVCDAKGASDC